MSWTPGLALGSAFIIFTATLGSGPAFIIFVFVLFSCHGCYLRRGLVLVGEGRQGFVEGHGSDPHLSLPGGEEDLVSGFEDLLISLVSEVFVTYMCSNPDGKFVRP